MHQKRKIVLLIIVFGLFNVNCEKRRKSGSRIPKFLSFNTLDGDVSVDLEFSIPFVSIPVKKTMEETFGPYGFGLPSVNVNLPALALGGIVVVGTTVVLPVLLKYFAALYPDQQYARFVDSTQFSTDHMMNFASHMMTDGRWLQGCAARVVCWSATTPFREQTEQFLDQISRNTILSTMINTTSVKEAYYSGVQGKECTDFGPCSIKENQIPMILDSITRLGNIRKGTGGI